MISYEWKSKILVLIRRYPCLDCKYIFNRSFYVHVRCEMLIIHFVSDGVVWPVMREIVYSINLAVVTFIILLLRPFFIYIRIDLRISDYSAALRCQDKHCQKTCRRWSFVCRLQRVLQSNIPKVLPGFIIPILLTTTSRWLRLKSHHHIRSYSQPSLISGTLSNWPSVLCIKRSG